MPSRWNDSQPIYWQLKEQTVAMILDGTLAEGEPLPSVRTVASDPAESSPGPARRTCGHHAPGHGPPDP